MKDLIKIDSLNYLDIFNNLSLNIKEGDYLCISGPNNCGKTTLIRILDNQIDIEFPIYIDNKKISDYKINDYNRIVQTIIPLEISFKELTLEEELLQQKNDNSKLYTYIIKSLKLSKLITKKIKDLTEKEIVMAQLIIGLLNEPKILLIDSLDSFFKKEELINLHKFIKDIKNKLGITIIETTTNLDNSIYASSLVIIANGHIELEGEPLVILEKDNIINKIGLRLPFMVDLSVKLKDYDLIDKIELDKDRMVDNLWK